VPRGELGEAGSWAEEHHETAWAEIHYYRHRADLRPDIAGLWDYIARNRLIRFCSTMDNADKAGAERAWRNADAIRAASRLARD
jgi:hypothetical protein